MCPIGFALRYYATDRLCVSHITLRADRSLPAHDSNVHGAGSLGLAWSDDLANWYWPE